MKRPETRQACRMRGIEAGNRQARTQPAQVLPAAVTLGTTPTPRRAARCPIRIPVIADPSDRTQFIPVGRRCARPAASLSVPPEVAPCPSPLDHVA